jgi:hypothetical protein
MALNRDSITARLDRVRSVADEYRSPAPPVPRSAKIELTARCDFQCFFCASHMRPREKFDMPWESYTRIVKQLRQLGVEQLGVFYLGESFLCDWLPEAIRYAKQECGYPYVFLTTNGRLATADRVRACILAGLDSLKFSFNFCGPRQFHDITRLGSGDYHAIVNNIKDACWIRDYVELTTGHRCGLYASSLLYDEQQRERMRPAVAEIRPCVDEHYWLPLYGRLRLPARAGKAAPAPGIEGGDEVLRKPLPCWSLFTEAHITCDGRLSACCFDHNERFNMGDLNHLPFLEAWHSQSFRQLRRAHLNEDVRGTVCEQCIGYE